MPQADPFYQQHHLETIDNPTPPRRTARQIETPPLKNEAPVRPTESFSYFKGVIQDVQVSQIVTHTIPHFPGFSSSVSIKNKDVNSCK